MNEDQKNRADQFIAEQIESVPHLEALLLAWNRRPHRWSLDEMAASLYLSREVTAKILDDLVRKSLISTEDSNATLYFFEENFSERDLLLRDVDFLYRRELLRITGIIHSKGSAAMRDFARAFRFKKEGE